jgi:regulatory protein
MFNQRRSGSNEAFAADVPLTKRALKAKAVGLLALREYTRAELLKKLSPLAETPEMMSEVLDELTAVIRQARERGLIHTDLQPRAVATFIQSYALGLLVHDLDPDSVDDEELVTVILTALRAILGPA